MVSSSVVLVPAIRKLLLKLEYVNPRLDGAKVLGGWLSQGCHVDHKTISHVSVLHPLECLIDFGYADHFALALLSPHFSEGPERTRVLACYAAVAGVGSSLGLVLGGLFAGALSWCVGFFMNVPIGIALILAAWRVLDETPLRPGHFDLAGLSVPPWE